MYGEQSQPELDITQNNTISSETNQEQLIIESIHGTINHIKTMNWKSLSDKMKESLTQLASELGKVISNDIFDDGKLNVASQHKNIDIVNEVEPLSWIKELNPLLQGFLQKCAAIDINRENNDKKNKSTCTFYRTGTLHEKYKYIYSICIQKELSFVQCDKQ